jgi:hypothetical protein
LPVCKNYSIISFGYLNVNWAKLRRIRSALKPIYCRIIFLFFAISL